MKIGIISDSHDRLPALRAAVSALIERRVEAILHAGDFVAPFAARLLAPPNVPADLPVHVIYGNNDGERAGLARVLPQLQDGPLRLTLGGRAIVMHHFLDWLSPADIDAAEVIISGHDHEVAVTRIDGKLFINPGECCGWLTDRCTCAILDTESLEVEVVEV